MTDKQAKKDKEEINDLLEDIEEKKHRHSHHQEIKEKTKIDEYTHEEVSDAPKEHPHKHKEEEE